MILHPMSKYRTIYLQNGDESDYWLQDTFA